MITDQVQTDSLKINYRIIGKGKPLLILHGWGGRLDYWQKTQKEIADHGYQVLIPDLPGFGSSDLPPKAWELDDYLDWTRKFLDVIQKKHPHFHSPFFLLGHSFGGRIATKIAAKKAIPLTTLILCNAAGIKPLPSLKIKIINNISHLGWKIIDCLKLHQLGAKLRTLFYYFIRQHDYLQVQGTMRESFKKIVVEDLSGLLPYIDAPTLIIWGKKDALLPEEMAHYFHRNIKNSKLEFIAESGHSPEIDTPLELSAGVIKFLDQYNGD
jgi:pimeloyl-ACP methyl ester carboxylesterase